MNHVRSLRYRLLLLLVLLLVAVPATAPSAAHSLAMPASTLNGVVRTAAGSIQLAPASAPVRAPVQAGFARFGTYQSAPQPLATATTRVALTWQADVPAATRLAIDLRGSPDGVQWQPWHTDLAAGAVQFAVPVQQVQYRLRLWGSATTSPSVDGVQISALPAAPAANTTLRATTQQPATTIAPTYRIRATRLGLVGYRTANGHIIQPRDWFVSLPSWRSLSSRGGYEYQVRISYNGRSVVAPVWDVGPWNTRDNFWDVEREQYNDLRRGWPQDHAAYFEGYNGGYAEKGYVILPTAIDIADGVWWDGLGINDGIAWVDVTFLWLGTDPATMPQADAPSSDPNASEYMVDELGPAFQRNDDGAWETAPDGCGNNQHALWTYSQSDPNAVQSKAFWQPALPVAGNYALYAYIPDCGLAVGATQAARYLIQHADGATEVVVDQAAQTGWVALGHYPFRADASGFVYLTDVAGDTGRAIWFDNLRWVPVREAPAAE